jgi:hypothetical protein
MGDGMAKWQQLRDYIFATYQVDREENEVIQLLFRIDGERTQLVLVSHTQTGAGVDFALIASPIADHGAVELGVLLRETSEYVVGGVVMYGNRIMLRHAVPLADLDVSDFETPLHLVLSAADAMEAKFLGTDHN